MNDIYIKEIDQTNEHLVRKIELEPEQEKFIETIDECLKEAEECNEWCPVALYNDENVVGFAMYGSFGPSKDTWIDRIIIDKKYQGKGFGKKAMLKLIDVVSKRYDVDVLYLSIVEGNEVAYNLYKSIGFQDTNEVDSNGELIFKYIVRHI